MQSLSRNLQAQGKKIGTVPTMGFLHEGHSSLIRLAKRHADIVVTTIFVNPTQFGPNEDFSKYPRDLEHDKKIASSAGTDYLFIPETPDMYPGNYSTYVHVEELTAVLEGASRPTHFRGVTTVVAKLFNIVKPQIAVFGQKDAQQAAVIKKMVKDLNFDVEIIVGPIVREPDGLAMSSRNVYLSSADRADSVVLSQSLGRAREMIEHGERQSSAIITEMSKMISRKPSARIDYISIADAMKLQECTTLVSGMQILVSLAVRFGTTRLIDNLLLTI